MLSISEKKDIIIDMSQTLPIEKLRMMLETIMSNENKEKIKEFPDGCRINLDTLNENTIEDLYHMVMN